jgi:Ca-activated chloride channel family protein
MKLRIILGCVALGMAIMATAQTSTKDLPSAPSATIMPAKKPAPPPPQAPAQQVPGVQQQPQSSPPPASTQTAPPATTQAPAQKPADTAPPQNQEDQEQNKPITTLVIPVNEVNVVFTVTDKHGRFIKDLKKDDFKVLDDNKPPAEIKNFSSETNLPLRVGLLIDSSNSIRDRFKFEQEAAIEFLNQIVRPKQDLAFVLGFDTTAEVTQDFTDNTELLSKGVRGLRPGGGTALFDAMYAACRDKLANASQGNYATRRAIILLSDGEDNQSRVTREEAVEMAQRAEVIVYAISTNITGIKSKGDKILERFAEATGGRLFTPFKLQDVADAFTEIQDELRSQYAIAYKPADFVADGRYRSIVIEAPERKNLRVRARRGYYAPMGKATTTASQGR